jgi:hypothetical protein
LVVAPVALCSLIAVLYAFALKRRESRKASRFLATLVAPAPSARAIRPQDVLGSWWFYVDAATSTVTIDLQADGHYKQVIIGNRGERIDCPGGTWALDGPHVELTSYRSPVRAVTENVRWFFGDWQKDLVLFAKDDPQCETMLLGLRRAWPSS